MTIGAASSSLISGSRLRSEISREVRVLVVAGGGGAGRGVPGGNPTYRGGPGGAGGFLEVLSVLVNLGTEYSVTVGAGGAANGTALQQGVNGGRSAFGQIYAYGGGGGGANSATSGGSTPSAWNSGMGIAGGSGGGAGAQANAFGTGGAALFGQGNAGGGSFFNSTGPVYNVGGGGGAGGPGGAASSGGHGAAGAGSVSSLTGDTYSAGGGASTGAGAANSGRGGGSTVTGFGTNGGSGVVVLRFSATLNITLSAGLSSTITFSGGDEIVTITGGTGTVTFS
jgi:hypothetical protein